MPLQVLNQTSLSVDRSRSQVAELTAQNEGASGPQKWANVLGRDVGRAKDPALLRQLVEDRFSCQAVQGRLAPGLWLAAAVDHGAPPVSSSPQT